MILFAEATLDPRAIITWLAVGVAVGWLAGKLTESPSYGLIGDLVVAVIGALAGGFLFGMYVNLGSEYLGGMLGALVGAGALILVARVVMRFRATD
jgi:uncharacterized membrane protein YeaQ/YmgE (transglycosylase-associated protein family)